MSLGLGTLALLAGLAAAAPSKEFDGAADGKAARAARGGDAVGFVLAAQEAELAIPAGDDALRNLFKEGAARLEADRVYARDIEPRLEFERLLRKHPGVSLEPFKDVEAKRAIVERFYDGLNGKGGTRVPVSQASAPKINGAFRSLRRRFVGR